MQNISRRGFVISAAAAGAAFGLDGPLEFIGSAFGQSNPSLLEKGFVKFKVGDVEVTQIYDGIWNRELQDGFVKNAMLADVQDALKAAGLAPNIVPIPFTVTAVTIGGKTTLIDSGTGTPGQVQPFAGLASTKNLTAAGIDAGKVENIVISHFHPDHISGLMAKDTNAEVFPKATIHVPAPELAWWTGPSVPQAGQGLATRIKATLGTWKNVKAFDGDKEVVPGVRPIATPGSHAGPYELSRGLRQPATHHPGRSHQCPGTFREKSRLACGIRYRRRDGGSHSSQDVRSRHRRQGDDHRLPLRPAGCRHARQGRQRLRLYGHRRLTHGQRASDLLRHGTYERKAPRIAVAPFVAGL